MWLRRETLFAFLQRNAERSAAFFGVPAGQVVEFRTELEILETLLGRHRPRGVPTLRKAWRAAS
jgi:hypothetical protein